MIYSSYKQLQGNTVDVGDYLVFTRFNDRYYVTTTHLGDQKRLSNRDIFYRLGICNNADTDEIQQQKLQNFVGGLGLRFIDGSCPEYRNLIDATTLALALFKLHDNIRHSAQLDLFE